MKVPSLLQSFGVAVSHGASGPRERSGRGFDVLHVPGGVEKRRRFLRIGKLDHDHPPLAVAILADELGMISIVPNAFPAASESAASRSARVIMHASALLGPRKTPTSDSEPVAGITNAMRRTTERRPLVPIPQPAHPKARASSRTPKVGVPIWSAGACSRFGVGGVDGSDVEGGAPSPPGRVDGRTAPPQETALEFILPRPTRMRHALIHGAGGAEHAKRWARAFSSVTHTLPLEATASAVAELNCPS